jgi:hypothetical protein
MARLAPVVAVDVARRVTQRGSGRPFILATEAERMVFSLFEGGDVGEEQKLDAARVYGAHFSRTGGSGMQSNSCPREESRRAYRGARSQFRFRY